MNHRTKEFKDFMYRKIEALDHRGLSIDDICYECMNLARWEVIDILQKIHGNNELKKQKKYERKRAF